MAACLVALVVALAFLLSEGPAPTTADSLSQRRREARSLLKKLNKPPLATIESPDGDIIDCVHISKQPAFDHPLLKNHTIQMGPSYQPGGMYHDSNIASHKINQTWHENGKCPKNTIPIRRTTEEEILRASSITRYGKKRNRSMPNLSSINDPATPIVSRRHQYAVASTYVDKFYGTKTTINLWEPMVERANDFSLAQLWIVGGSYSSNNFNTIEAGWKVFPDLYRDYYTRLFIYWTRDAYGTTGCYNLLCSGFVQTNNYITIGCSFSSMSTYGGTQYSIDILIWKDQIGGNWWLQVGRYYVGYWPSSIFSYLGDSASYIMWGGEVFSPDAGQTSTDMGSGHFPAEQFGKASYIKNIQVVNSSNYLIPPSDLQFSNEQPDCYNVPNDIDVNWGTYIYYGAPGRTSSAHSKKMSSHEHPFSKIMIDALLEAQYK